jgi:hypothetical protein
MQIKIKSILLILSLLINAFFFTIIILGSFSKTSRFSFPSAGDHIAAASIVSFPSNTHSVLFNSIEIIMSPQEKIFYQFSLFSEGSQSNLLLSPLYDPYVVSVVQTGYGLEITALSEGSTVIQTLTNDGIRDIALIFVEKKIK